MDLNKIKKRIFVGLILQLIVVLSYSQSAEVKGGVVAEQDGSPLIGTYITIENNDVVKQTVSDHEGKFLLENVVNGTYELVVSYIGYQNFSKTIQVNGNTLVLGNLVMKEGVELEEIQIVEQIVPVIQKGDTTEFNSDAYTVMADADASDLLEKMPTVIIDDGTVQAQGEDVKKVLVDGKPFFGNDPTAALKNLPAEVIDKIQIYDEQSDQAKFTGFDDGETSKTINIITKASMRSGQFGKIYAGYGYDDKYQIGGNINIFNGDQRISVIGMSNNVNQQNFSSEDLLGVVGSTGERGGGRRRGGPGGRDQGGTSASDFLISQQGGITTSNAIGVNFTDKWGDKLDVSASYFFNKSDNLTEQYVTKQYFDSESLSEVYDEESLVESTNINHRLTGVFDYKINENNSIILRSSATWQGNEGEENVLGETVLNSNFLNQIESSFSADLYALNISNSLLWRHKFAKQGRTFSVNVTSELSPQNGESYLLSDNIFGTESTSLDQYATFDKSSWNISANVEYTEPLTDKSQLLFEYKTSYQQELNNKETFDNDESDSYNIFNEELSNVFSNDYVSNALGAGYRYRSGDWRLMARGLIQQASLLTEQTLPYNATTENNFLDFLPMAMVSYRPSRTQDIRLMYRASTSLPSITQLQNVIDNSNPVQLTIGNPNLIQGYQHNLMTRFKKTNTEKSSVIFGMLSGTMTNNYIGSSTFLSASDYDSSLEEDAQITLPVNLDGYYNLRSFVTYGFPVNKIKSNLNIDFTANHTHTPGLINEEMNYANNSNAGIGLTLSSNISDQVDFTISSRSNFNVATNTLLSESNTNYLNQKSKLKFNWIVWKGLIFRTELTHDFYDGLSDDFDQNYILWNMSLGKKLFKDDRGEISLTIFDLLNQNTSLSRNVTEVYTEDIQTNVLQQYVMLSFKYDLRHFTIKS